SGLPIEGLQIGSGPVKNLVVATHHGNEYGATEVAKAFAASMAEHPIPGQSVYIVPVLNVSGFDRRDRWERGSAGQSFDPNRDYPGPCGTEGPFRLKSTAALARFVEAEGIVTAATLHTKHPAVVYPWGFGAADLSTHYDGLFRSLAEAATVESGYRTGNSTELIYAADGTFEDYAFWQHGIWAMLFEIGSTHSPSAEQVAEQNRVNVSGLRRMLEQAPRERAERHAFESQCQYSVFNVDLHDE
ncbi:MAG: succinylglutamate desuccinylase/aspartoacylase family protein, partial [Oligoflexia bacterium]|nr:succinylglutamate desuccinylase/aspartoacylase family protein [Oligoflexia bacterium]